MEPDGQLHAAHSPDPFDDVLTEHPKVLGSPALEGVHRLGAPGVVVAQPSAPDPDPGEPELFDERSRGGARDGLREEGEPVARLRIVEAHRDHARESPGHEKRAGGRPQITQREAFASGPPLESCEAAGPHPNDQVRGPPEPEGLAGHRSQLVHVSDVQVLEGPASARGQRHVLVEFEGRGRHGRQLVEHGVTE